MSVCGEGLVQGHPGARSKQEQTAGEPVGTEGPRGPRGGDAALPVRWLCAGSGRSSCVYFVL